MKQQPIRYTITILSFFFLLRSNAAAQNAPDTLYFAGHIKASKSVSFQYYLRFSIDDSNRVTGYSLTDPQGPYETKTKITGAYNKKKGIMTFQETSILRSKAETATDLCFVKASLKVKRSKLVGQTLTGRFTGTDPGSNNQCARGKIKLLNTVRIKQMELRRKQKEEKKEEKREKSKVAGETGS